MLVVGAGPAGLKAAEVAARRGHSVTLWDREAGVGGQVRRFARVRYRAEYMRAIDHLDTQIAKLPVEVKLRHDASAADVEAFAADVTVLATGSVPGDAGFRHLRPDRHPIAGLGGPHVLTTWAALENTPSGGRALVVDDGENAWKLIATAIHLADCGNAVDVLTPHASVGTGLGPMALGPAINRLFELKVGMHVYSAVRQSRGRTSTCTTSSPTNPAVWGRTTRS